jgi:hypothetical protein
VEHPLIARYAVSSLRSHPVDRVLAYVPQVGYGLEDPFPLSYPHQKTYNVLCWDVIDYSINAIRSYRRSAIILS